MDSSSGQLDQIIDLVASSPRNCQVEALIRELPFVINGKPHSPATLRELFCSTSFDSHLRRSQSEETEESAQSLLHETLARIPLVLTSCLRVQKSALDATTATALDATTATAPPPPPPPSGVDLYAYGRTESLLSAHPRRRLLVRPERLPHAVRSLSCSTDRSPVVSDHHTSDVVMTAAGGASAGSDEDNNEVKSSTLSLPFRGFCWRSLAAYCSYSLTSVVSRETLSAGRCLYTTKALAAGSPLILDALPLFTVSANTPERVAASLLRLPGSRADLAAQWQSLGVRVWVREGADPNESCGQMQQHQLGYPLVKVDAAAFGDMSNSSDSDCPQCSAFASASGSVLPHNYEESDRSGGDRSFRKGHGILPLLCREDVMRVVGQLHPLKGTVEAKIRANCLSIPNYCVQDNLQHNLVLAANTSLLNHSCSPSCSVKRGSVEQFSGREGDESFLNPTMVLVGAIPPDDLIRPGNTLCTDRARASDPPAPVSGGSLNSSDVNAMFPLSDPHGGRVAVDCLPIGSELTIDYISTVDFRFAPSNTRRKLFASKYGVPCACVRCMSGDPVLFRLPKKRRQSSTSDPEDSCSDFLVVHVEAGGAHSATSSETSSLRCTCVDTDMNEVHHGLKGRLRDAIRAIHRLGEWMPRGVSATAAWSKAVAALFEFGGTVPDWCRALCHVTLSMFHPSYFDGRDEVDPSLKLERFSCVCFVWGTICALENLPQLLLNLSLAPAGAPQDHAGVSSAMDAPYLFTQLGRTDITLFLNIRPLVMVTAAVMLSLEPRSLPLVLSMLLDAHRIQAWPWAPPSTPLAAQLPGFVSDRVEALRSAGLLKGSTPPLRPLNPVVLIATARQYCLLHGYPGCVNQNTSIDSGDGPVANPCSRQLFTCSICSVASSCSQGALVAAGHQMTASPELGGTCKADPEARLACRVMAHLVCWLAPHVSVPAQ